MDYKIPDTPDNLRLYAVFRNGDSKNRDLPNIEDPDTETGKLPKDDLEQLGDLWIWPPPLL